MLDAPNAHCAAASAAGAEPNLRVASGCAASISAGLEAGQSVLEGSGARGSEAQSVLILLVDGDQSRLIRRRESFAQLFQDEIQA